LKYLISELLKLIEVEPKSKYETFIEHARKICSDKDDVPYLALSLYLGKAPSGLLMKNSKKVVAKLV
jgi:predicted nucleic acid-binding protein